MIKLEEQINNVATNNDECLHNAHLDCQRDEFFYVMVCGEILPWYEEEEDGVVYVECVLCNNSYTCPKCGELLE